MGLFDVSEEKKEEWMARYRQAVQPHVQGDVQAVGLFQRRGQYLLSIPVIGQLGAIFYLAYQAIFKRKAAGLPSSFIIAVTPDKVHAFKYRQSYSDVKVKKEVAVWDRDAIKVTGTTDAGMATQVNLESNEDGQVERIQIQAPRLSSNPWSADVVKLLS